MNQKLPAREEVQAEMTWRLEDIYPDETLWEQELGEAKELAGRVRLYEGRLSESAGNLYEALRLYDACALKLDRVGGYAFMRRDQDAGNSRYQGMELKSQSASVRISEELAFLEPEILMIGDDAIARFYEEEPRLRDYEVTIREIRRRRDHTLGKEMEALLASAGEMAMSASNGFGMLSNADLKFPSVTDSDGNVIELSNGRFVPLQMSSDRELRKDSFEKYYTRYSEFKNTWAALYDGQVKQQVFFARARKYPSSFEAAVDGNNVDPSVCDHLIDSIRGKISYMHRYVSLRRKMLGVDELHMYDVYVPIVAGYDRKFTYEEAKAISLKALAPLGEEYLSVVTKAYEERWIDVYENVGKRSGAYSSGVYGVHPYMLLNYTDTLDDVFTLVHEMGHSMHTWYSDHAQSHLNSKYRIFVAEVASTTNEILLLEYLLARAEDPAERAYLLNHYLECFKGTVYRQTMFEEFERRTNAMAEEGTPLTSDVLCDLYLNLNKEYFGSDMVSDPLIAYEWCRIPHFYYNFYVYQYATSFAASVAIAHRILEHGEKAVGPYLEFLKSGCTQDPVSLLKIAGVDLSTSGPVDEALEVFRGVIEEMEVLSEKI